MQDQSSDAPDFQRLRLLQIIALVAGVAVLAATLYVFGQFQRQELAPIVICFALASIAYSGIFYFGCLFFEGSLQKYIVSDDTVIKGQTVDMVTTTEDSGDDRVDKWVGAYVFARNQFGLSLLPLVLLGGLFLFA
ncbi:MAG: hypothetical protein V3V03_03005 [Hyphomonadaceae bacterium]